ERARVGEARPDLRVQLESRRLPTREPAPFLVFTVTNSGQATALDTTFRLLPSEGQYEYAERDLALGSIAPSSTATARVSVHITPSSEAVKFLILRYQVRYRVGNNDELLPVTEDTVHFGDFRPIKNPFDEARPVSDLQMFKGRTELLGWLMAKLVSEDR